MTKSKLAVAILLSLAAVAPFAFAAPAPVASDDAKLPAWAREVPAASSIDCDESLVVKAEAVTVRRSVKPAVKAPAKPVKTLVCGEREELVQGRGSARTCEWR